MERRRVISHQCRCILLPQGSMVRGEQIRCESIVDNPDQPICDNCEVNCVNLPNFTMVPIEVRHG